MSRLAEIKKKAPRFLAAGAIASAVDYFLYLFLTEWAGMKGVAANSISYPVSVLLNFFLQKRFVFDLNRSDRAAFGWAMLVSAGGFLLSTGIIYTLNLWPFFRQYQFLTKLIDKVIVLFYNFFCKRYAFEKRFI